MPVRNTTLHWSKTSVLFIIMLGTYIFTQMTIFWVQKRLLCAQKCRISNGEVRSVTAIKFQRPLHIILTKSLPFQEQRLSFLSSFNVTCPWQPFASLVSSPRNLAIAWGCQFSINKSEKIKVGVKWGFKCKYKIWEGVVLIYRL